MVLESLSRTMFNLLTVPPAARLLFPQPTVERTADLTTQYRISTQHLELLVPTLIQSGEPPASRTSKNSEGAEERRSKERRGAYEAWISLPYLETRGAQSLLGFEALCEVEIGRWNE